MRTDTWFCSWFMYSNLSELEVRNHVGLEVISKILVCLSNSIVLLMSMRWADCYLLIILLEC